MGLETVKNTKNLIKITYENMKHNFFNKVQIPKNPFVNN